MTFLRTHEKSSNLTLCLCPAWHALWHTKLHCMPCALRTCCRCYRSWPLHYVPLSSSYPRSSGVTAMCIAPSVASSLVGFTSCIWGCKPKKSALWRTSIMFSKHWLTCFCPRLFLTSVRHTIFHHGLLGSLEKTCWQCNGNAKEVECTLQSMRLKLAMVNPYWSCVMLGCRGSWLGQTQSHTSIVVQWFRWSSSKISSM